MENIEALMIELAIAVSILIFLFPFLLGLHNIYDRLTILRVDSFEKFKEKMKWRIWPDKKMFNPTTWFKPVTYTIEDFENAFIEMEEKFKRGRLFNITIKILLFFIIFNFYVTLAKAIGYYYIKLKTGYEKPLEFPLKEVLSILVLSSWISLVLFRKFAIDRINMYLKKFSEFKNAEHLKEEGTTKEK